MILNKKILSTLLLGLLIGLPSTAQKVTVSNNLLYDAWLTPNLRVGVRLSPHWSAGVSAGYRPWPTDDNTSRKWKHLLVSPDLRYWTDSVNVHHFFGVNLIYSHYNVADLKFPFGLYKGVRDERRQGDLGALGVFYGYSWPLGRHWNIEAVIGAAVGYTKYDRYACGHCGAKIGTEKKVFVMPQAALNVVYNFPGRPVKTVEEPAITIPSVVVDTAEVVQPPVVIPVKPDTPEVETPVVKEPSIDVLRRSEPMIAHISEYQPYDRNQVLRRDKKALFVYFPLMKSDIQPDYRDNKQTLERILNVTEKVMADNSALLCKIQIVGLASWDGNKSFNERLAMERAKSLKKYVQDTLPIDDDQFELTYGGEDWADFRDEVEEEIARLTNSAEGDTGRESQTAISQLQEVVSIIDSETNLSRREQQIRKLRGGRTYQYIRDHHLADQRNAGYLQIYFDYVK